MSSREQHLGGARGQQEQAAGVAWGPGARGSNRARCAKACTGATGVRGAAGARAVGAGAANNMPSAAG